MLKDFEVGRVFGIPIKVDVTLLLVVPVFAWIIGSRIGRTATVLSRWTGVALDASALAAGQWPWILGAVAAVGLFVSVGLHELGHSLVALHLGHEIESITLWVLGGVAGFADTPQDWRHELAIAIAGPIVSVLLGVSLYGAVRALPAGIDRATFVLGYLALLNVVLAGFNLLPAFPMDGGRVLRALLARTRPIERATSIAASVGKVIAVLMAIVGILSFNVILLAIAFFVYVGAGAEAAQTRLRAAFEDVTAGDLMTPASELDVASPGETAAELYDRMYRERHTGYPVLEDGRLVGVVTLEDVSGAMSNGHENATVEQIMSTDLVTTSPETGAFEAFETLGENGVGRLLVTEDGELVGLLSRSDFVRALNISGATVSNRSPLGGRRDHPVGSP